MKVIYAIDTQNSNATVKFTATEWEKAQTEANPDGSGRYILPRVEYEVVTETKPAMQQGGMKIIDGKPTCIPCGKY